LLTLDSLLKEMVVQKASDLYLTTDARPSLRVNGLLVPLGDEALKAGMVKALAEGIMDKAQTQEFAAKLEQNLAISREDLGRFRVNIFIQRGEISMVVRSIATHIPSFDDLGLPKSLQPLILEKNGLVLFVGATGSGKSTSLASLIDYRNANMTGHIITIEDPIEFFHSHKKSIVNQREVGVDTRSYHEALVNTLRQAPDVILIGEIRNQETMEHALAFAETGHLCLSTLHANNANQAIERIVNFFPEERRDQLLLDLSFNLRAFVSQRLIPTLTGKRTAAVEILLGTPYVRELIKRGEIGELKEAMEKDDNQGMQSFDIALFKLWEAGAISEEEAIRNADSKNNVRLKIQLKTKGEAAAQSGDVSLSTEGNSILTPLYETEAEPTAEAFKKPKRWNPFLHKDEQEK